MRLLIGVASFGIVVGLGACSPAGQKTETVEAPPPVESVAAAPAASAAPAAAAAAAAATTAAAAGPGVVMALDIKDTNGVALSGDTARGAKIFLQCATCHSPEPGVTVVGPSLYGIVGRHSGSIPGFRYSDANRNSGITWTEQEMFNYLLDPQKRIPGTLMTFVGLKNAQQRADVIAFLKQNAEKKR
jgi:cytochrome c